MGISVCCVLLGVNLLCLSVFIKAAVLFSYMAKMREASVLSQASGAFDLQHWG